MRRPPVQNSSFPTDRIAQISDLDALGRSMLDLLPLDGSRGMNPGATLGVDTLAAVTPGGDLLFNTNRNFRFSGVNGSPEIQLVDPYGNQQRIYGNGNDLIIRNNSGQGSLLLADSAGKIQFGNSGPSIYNDYNGTNLNTSAGLTVAGALSTGLIQSTNSESLGGLAINDATVSDRTTVTINKNGATAGAQLLLHDGSVAGNYMTAGFYTGWGYLVIDSDVRLGKGAYATAGLGMWGVTPPPAQPGTPADLAGVIALLQSYGLCA